MSESDLRSLQNAQYSVEKPLSILAKSYFKENPVVVASGTAGTKSASIILTCPNLMTRTFIGVYNTTNNGKLGSFEPIKTVSIKSSGRVLYEYGLNDNVLENALFYSKGNFSSDPRPTSSTTDYNLFVHNWGLFGNDQQFSGGISGKGSSNLMIDITFNGLNATAYSVIVESEYQNIISVSGGSGKISNSISL